MLQSKSTSPLKTILITGFVAGFLDITAAIVILGKMNATGVLKYIASGAFGKKAFAGGTEMVIYGLLMHFIIAYSFTILYLFAYPYIGLFKKQKVLSGLLYGIFVWAVMNLLVLPFTNVAQAAFRWDKALLNMSILMVMIGLPIALMVNHYYEKNTAVIKN